MKPNRPIAALSLILALAAACKPPARSTVQEGEAGPNYGVLRQYLVNFLFKFSDYAEICTFADELKGENECFKAVVQNSCKITFNTGKEVFGQAVNEERAKKIAEEEKTDPAAGAAKIALRDSARDAIKECVKGAAEPVLGKVADYVKRRFGVDLAQAAKVPKAKDLGRELARWACTGGAKALGDAIAKTRSTDFDNACQGVLPGGASGEASRSRLASCFRTAGSVCEIFTSKGKVNVGNFLPSSDGEIEGLARDLASDAVTGLCGAGAAATKLSCSVINAAAAQIKDAILTGDNDWANCVGTTQLGTCLGKVWGSNGFTNNNGVEPAKTATDANGSSFDYRGCCLCDRQKFVEYSFSSEVFQMDTYLSVIQDGDFATGNCAYQERKGKVPSYLENHDGRPVFMRYQNCRKVYVAGQVCAPNPEGKAFVWNPNRKAYDTYRPAL